MAVYTPQSIVGGVDAIVERDQPDTAHPNGLRIAVAMELARRGVDRPALLMLEAARAIRPLPHKIDALAKALEERLQTSDAKGLENTVPSEKSRAHQIKVRLANRLARLRGLVRRLRKQ